MKRLKKHDNSTRALRLLQKFITKSYIGEKIRFYFKRNKILISQIDLFHILLYVIQDYLALKDHFVSILSQL
jgi:hypothetical protein